MTFEPRAARTAMAWGLAALLFGCSQVLGLSDGTDQGPCSVDEQCAPGFECRAGTCRSACASADDCESPGASGGGDGNMSTSGDGGASDSGTGGSSGGGDTSATSEGGVGGEAVSMPAAGKGGGLGVGGLGIAGLGVGGLPGPRPGL